MEARDQREDDRVEATIPHLEDLELIEGGYRGLFRTMQEQLDRNTSGLIACENKHDECQAQLTATIAELDQTKQRLTILEGQLAIIGFGLTHPMSVDELPDFISSPSSSPPLLELPKGDTDSHEG